MMPAMGMPMGAHTQVQSPGAVPQPMPMPLPMPMGMRPGMGVPSGVVEAFPGAPLDTEAAAALTAAGMAAAQRVTQGIRYATASPLAQARAAVAAANTTAARVRTVAATTTAAGAAPTTPAGATTAGAAGAAGAPTAGATTTAGVAGPGAGIDGMQYEPDRWKKDLLTKDVNLQTWKLRGAARLIVPGATAWNVNDKTHFPKGSLKPTVEAMQWELLQRDRSAQCKHYRADRLCEKLHGTAVPDGTPPIILPQQPEAAAADKTQGADGRKSRGWKTKIDMPRLCHVIVELKDDFLRRDAKPGTRGELESVPRNAFWQKAARKFNDPGFKPTKLDGEDVLKSLEFEALSVDHDPDFTVDAKMLLHHWGQARRTLVDVMALFRTSGEGDGGSKGVDVDTSNKVHSSQFAGFCRGKPATLYLYELFLPYDLLASAQIDMPKGSRHSSDGKGRQTARPRRTRTSAKAKWTSIVATLEKPVSIAQSANQKAADYYEALNGKARTSLANEELATHKEEALEKVEQKIEDLTAAEKGVPVYLRQKRKRLLQELEDIEKNWAAQAPPVFEDDHMPRAKNHKQKHKWHDVDGDEEDDPPLADDDEDEDESEFSDEDEGEGSEDDRDDEDGEGEGDSSDGD